MAWWNINVPLSYNALFNFIIGNRGSGKTFGCKEYAIKHFLQTGKQFIYIRRYNTEFKDNANFFNAVSRKFEDCSFSVKGKTYLINDKVAGFAMTLSTSKAKKSTEYPDVDMIIFDEFIIEKGVYHYLPNEVETFLDAYETIARMRDVKCFFLSNAVTVVNPYFTYFNLTLPYGKLIRCKKDILLQLVQDPEFIDAKKNTRFGRIIDGTAYSKYSIDNQFVLDDYSFIEKKGEGCKYWCTFIYESNSYGVWVDNWNSKIFISQDTDPSCRAVYSTTTKDHQPNTILFKSPRKSPVFFLMIQQFEYGAVRFENLKCKSVFLEILKLARR